MASKFRSSKSYPRQPHVCNAPIPGNPQPPAEKPSGIWVVINYIALGPSGSIKGAIALQPKPTGPGGRFVGQGLDSNGYVLGCTIGIAADASTWDATFGVVIPFFANPTAKWPIQQSTQATGWYILETLGIPGVGMLWSSILGGS
jgi:hypothetical protein